MVRPAIPAPPYEGGCLCGAVRYRLNARPLAVNACHCVDCKRSSGTGAGVFLHAKREDFVLEQGELSHFCKTADSGREIDIAHCAVCATRMWHEPRAVPELVLVAAGTLDDSRWAVPTSHIWTQTAAADAVMGEDTLVYEKGAPDRQAIWDNFAKVYGD